jgi:hypothetical protein
MPTGNPTVDRAIDAHGGEARWRKHSSLHATWTFRGMMFKLRLREARLRGLRATLSTIRPEVEIEPFPGPGGAGRFTPEAVELRGGDRPARRLERPRESFRSLASLAWWNDFQMLYFAGYVLWNYAQLPFLLLQPGLAFASAGSTTAGGELWDKVEVTFPIGFPTHSPRQTFYFGPDGRLRRHDYVVSIMSPLARGARFIHRYQQVEGLTLPARIEMKLGTTGERYLSSPSLGFVDLDDVSLG